MNTIIAGVAILVIACIIIGAPSRVRRLWQKRKRRHERKVLERSLKGKKTITFESTDGRWCLFDVSTDATRQRFIERFMSTLKKGDEREGKRS